MSESPGPQDLQADTEEVDALVVIDAEPPVGRSTIKTQLEMLRSSTPVATAAVAATGFLAGAAAIGIAHRRIGRPARRKAERRLTRGRGRGRGELVQIVASRSLLVDVHLLDSLGKR